MQHLLDAQLPADKVGVTGVPSLVPGDHHDGAGVVHDSIEPSGDQRGEKAPPLRPATGVSSPVVVSISQIELTARSDMMSFERRT